MNNKRIVIIFSCFYEPFMSGAERFVKEVVERLKNNRSFVIITAKLRPDLAREEDFGGYKVVRVGKGDKWDKIRYIWLAPLEAKKYNPSIIHAVMESYAGIALWLAKYMARGAKRILTLQSGNLDAQIWSKVPILWSGIHKSPDHITAISTFLADRAKRLGAKNVEVVPNGFNMADVRTYGSTGHIFHKHRILCVARLSWEKDHKNLISAMPKILEKYPDAELILVGDGPLREEVEYQIKELDLKNKITILGNQPHIEVLQELIKADVFICPSLAEGLGIVFIEAQACEVPAIGTRVGGIPDVIKDGETGLLIEPNSSEQIAEAIMKIFDMDNAKRISMIVRARNSAIEKFNWDNIADKVDRVYKKQSKPSILIATGIYPPDIGGPAIYSKLISGKLMERGHTVQVLTYGSSKILNPKSEILNKFKIQNSKFKIHYVSRKLPAGIRHLAYFWQVLKLGRNADIIYIQDSVSVGFPTALANLFLKKKLILKVVGDYAWEQARQVKTKNEKVKSIFLDDFYPYSKNHPFKIDLLYLIQNWVAGKADKIITPSFYLRGILTGGWKVNENKVKVIYNSFNAPSVIPHEATRNEERRCGIPSCPSVIASPVLGARQSRPFKILSVGRLVPWKGFDALIEVVKDMPNVELEIVGDGPMKDNYELLITNYELKDRVRLSGRLSHDEVVQKMCSSDLFVLNTAYEGLSHVILESMACGLPVAVSRAGGNPELVGHNEERGYLFEYNNKEEINHIISHRVYHRVSHRVEVFEKTKKAKEFVAGFNEEMMINKIEELFKKLI